MNKELVEKITSKYYEMFHMNEKVDSKPTMYNNTIECGDGWFDIISQLCEELYAMCPKVVQIKEKFGGLRFYASFTSNYSEQAWKLIRETEEASCEICETCGEKGEMRMIDGRMAVRCNKCYEKLLQKNI